MPKENEEILSEKMLDDLGIENTYQDWARDSLLVE